MRVVNMKIDSHRGVIESDSMSMHVDACSFDEYAASLSRVQKQNCAETTLCRWLLLVEMISSLCYNVRFCLSSLCVEVQRPHPH